MKILGVIPARGGSKRLPRKNIKKILGKPLIGYTIEAANKSTYLTDVVFSTDDEEIRQIAIELGANAPFLRPNNLAGDEIRNSATMIHALNYMENQYKTRYDAIVLLQPTSPLRDNYHIDEALQVYINSEAISLASVKGPYKKRDINLKRIDSGRLVNLIEKNEDYFIYNAAIYVVSRDWLLDQESFTSKDEVPYYMDDVSSVDVDERTDFIIARALLEARENEKI